MTKGIAHFNLGSGGSSSTDGTGSGGSGHTDGMGTAGYISHEQLGPVFIRHEPEDFPKQLLRYIGEDPDRGGLLETPKRVLKAWKHWTSGYAQDPAEILKVFEDGAENYDQIIVVKDIPVYSHCEHHCAPFFGIAHVGYIPNGKIVGLSKLSRLVDVFARRLQVQERLTQQIAQALQDNLEPLGVGVVLECRHMCLESRGISRQGTSTVTSALRGCIKDEHEARAEFFSMIKGVSK